MTPSPSSPSSPPPFRRHVLASVALCVLGGLGLFLRWETGPAPMGFTAWQAGAMGSVLVVLVAILYATSSATPAPRWRPAVTMVAGSVILALFNLYVYVGANHAWTRYAGPWMTLLAAVLLLAVAADEIRRSWK